MYENLSFPTFLSLKHGTDEGQLNGGPILRNNRYEIGANFNRNRFFRLFNIGKTSRRFEETLTSSRVGRPTCGGIEHSGLRFGTERYQGYTTRNAVLSEIIGAA